MHFVSSSRWKPRIRMTSLCGPWAAAIRFSARTMRLLVGTVGVAINRLRIATYGNGSSADGKFEIFFNNMQISPRPPILER